MKMADLFLAQLDAEAVRTRTALARVPEGRDDWKPHEKSMPFGRLAMLVARMPSWLPLILNKDELDLNPTGGSNIDQRPLRTSAELVQGHDEGDRFALDDDEVAPSRLGARRERGSEAHRRARYVHAPLASSRPAHRLLAAQRHRGAGDLWTVGGRGAICVRFGLH